MTGCASQNEQMPYEVVIGNFFKSIKKDSKGIKETAKKQQPNT